MYSICLFYLLRSRRTICYSLDTENITPHHHIFKIWLNELVKYPDMN